MTTNANATPASAHAASSTAAPARGYAANARPSSAAGGSASATCNQARLIEGLKGGSASATCGQARLIEGLKGSSASATCGQARYIEGLKGGSASATCGQASVKTPRSRLCSLPVVVGDELARRATLCLRVSRRQTAARARAGSTITTSQLLAGLHLFPYADMHSLKSTMSGWGCALLTSSS